MARFFSVAASGRAASALLIALAAAVLLGGCSGSIGMIGSGSGDSPSAPAAPGGGGAADSDASNVAGNSSGDAAGNGSSNSDVAGNGSSDSAGNGNSSDSAGNGNSNSDAGNGNSNSAAGNGSGDAAGAPGSASNPAADQASSSGATAESIYSAIAESVEMPEMMQVPLELISDYYGISQSDCADAVFYICVDSLRADEIVIANAADDAAAARILEKLESRLTIKADAAKGYSPAQYAIIQECEARRDGLTVAMLVSPDAKTMTGIYESRL